MAKVVIMERSDGGVPEGDADCRDGERQLRRVGIMAPCTTSCEPVSTTALRGNPNLSPEQCFGLAWGSLTLSAAKPTAQTRSLGSFSDNKRKPRGSANHQCAPIGAAKGINTMKHDEQISILLKAIRGVLADDELTKAERGDVVARDVRGLRRAHWGAMV